MEIFFMSKEFKEYNNELKKLKINKINFDKHTIDKQELIMAYEQLGQTLSIDELQNDDLNELIKYEEWLLRES